MQNFIYEFIQFLARMIFRIFFRVEIVGQKNIPKTGAYIFASNHLSNLDPPLVGCFSTRHDVYYFAKEELFKNKIFGAFLKYIKAFPVKRGKVDINAMNYVFEILKNNHCLVIFPEGTRRKNNKYYPKKGLGFIYSNLKTNVSIIPTKVINTDKFYSFKKMRLIYGKPLKLDKNMNYLEMSKFVLEKIDNLYF
ncbi:MAG: 1-acyl-sn-glycerol-3-phosphate acyltransferase [Elusimicrobiota bacterium]|jgi:1-acyl-sn-glycerol-3-phosphate acyltransferase|nr:1-acyl-sn-glycerol-3-phosphate acyltransferase [Elusimicrobiota bacterium]